MSYGCCTSNSLLPAALRHSPPAKYLYSVTPLFWVTPLASDIACSPYVLLADTRQQFYCGVPQNSGALGVGQCLGSSEVLTTANRKIAPQVRIVRAVENPIDSDDGPEKLQYRIMPGQRGVPVEPAEGLGGRPAFARAVNHAHFVDDGEARREVGDGASRVGEDVLDVRCPCERVAVVKVRDRAGRIGDEVDERVRKAERMRSAIGRRRG